VRAAKTLAVQGILAVDVQCGSTVDEHADAKIAYSVGILDRLHSVQATRQLNVTCATRRSPLFVIYRLHCVRSRPAINP
jgi:hypothetical protein